MTSSLTPYRDLYTTNKGTMESMKADRFRKQINLNDRFHI